MLIFFYKRIRKLNSHVLSLNGDQNLVLHRLVHVNYLGNVLKHVGCIDSGDGVSLATGSLVDFRVALVVGITFALAERSSRCGGVHILAGSVG